ncbi:hypothetical protein LV82_02575 [Albidovulum inexpectatum]|uniref:Uncharacterized protein n=1 Tax=Albidovulum inexpectatum TaxID=196587 RepID=A0A2S5JE46_9RHOB|nr:hypothetical protein [Albidovulum inexpectatum]PPB79784.1 hypothetical protein LV82_02575 [Albidovulum inexpectatum]
MTWSDDRPAGPAERHGKHRSAPVQRLHIDTAMDAMCERYGDHDAIAELIAARWGTNTCHATISRKRSGSLSWSVMDVVAIEDALGSYPVTKLLARRIEWCRSSLSPVDAAKALAKEAGEAIAAMTGAALSGGLSDRAQAITEIDEAIEALRAARAALEAQK